MYTKCIEIDDNRRFKLLTPDKDIIEVSKEELDESLLNERLKVINLKKKDGVYTYKWDLDEIHDYVYLSTDKQSESISKASMKADLLGINTHVTGSNEIYADRISDDLVITDQANVLTHALSAKTVIFKGNKPLVKKVDNKGWDSGLSLRCRTAIINNRCVFGQLVYNMSVNVWSPRVHISHEFIDENTVYEMLVYLEHVIHGIFGGYVDALVQVNFAKQGINLDNIFDKTKALIYNKLYGDKMSCYKLDLPIEENFAFLSYMSLACSMYVSTNYKYDELLEMAVFCDEEIMQSGYTSASQQDSHKLVRDLLHRLMSGMRF